VKDKLLNLIVLVVLLHLLVILIVVLLLVQYWCCRLWPAILSSPDLVYSNALLVIASSRII